MNIKSPFLFIIVFTILLPFVKLADQVCSSFCAPTGCIDNGWTPSDCNACNVATYGWTSTGSSCEVTATSRQYIDSSQDAGGSITVLPVISNACTGFPAAVTTYGEYKANQIITIQLSPGTTISHYQIDLIFTIILIDTNEGGDQGWDSSANLSVSLINITSSAVQQTITNFRLNGGDLKGIGRTYCKATNKEDVYAQFKGTFKHNQTSNIKFEITTTNSKLNAVFAIKQFILVAVKCHIGCLTCNGSSNINRCFSCNPDQGYMLNNYSCLTECGLDYGYTENPAVCVYCNLYCKNCSGVFDNCSLCQNTSPWASYLMQNITLGYYTCVVNCDIGYFKNDTLRTCDYCDYECYECISYASKCTSCPLNYGWYNYTCYSSCPIGLYFSNNGTNCTLCNLTCISCLNQTYCYDCVLSGTNQAYFLDFICYKTCPDGFYPDKNYDLGPNTCILCTSPCTKCTGSPKPCQSCDNTAFLLIDECVASCPDGFVENIITRICINCSTDCVDVNINMYFADSLSQKLYADVTFSKQMNFSSFDYENFHTVSIGGLNPSQYNVTCIIINSFTYRIVIEPLGYLFLYNQTASIITKAEPVVYQTSNDSTPFKPQNYMKTATINWFLMKSPQMTELEKSIINNLAGINNVIASVTTSPALAQVKKSGIFALLFAGAQITTCSVFLKSIPAQNMYEGVRFWGMFVLYDVPQWEQNSKIKNKVFSPDVYDLTKDSRRLFNMNSIYWRFHRTGQSSFFIYDVYIPLLLIVICWITVLIGYILRRCNKNNLKGFQATFYTIFHKIHEVSIMYLTLAMMMEWIYFDGNSGTRWLSLFVCLLCTGYFVCYELYIYYDMIKYPEAVIGSQKFQYYLIKYGSFLKNIRYEQYDIQQQWSPKHWFRPYNYHFLSYYKKFCMLIAFPIFYEVSYLQILVVLLIQILQIVRFVKTNPYYTRWRTIYRFSLELCLFSFFLILLILQFQIDKITDSTNPNLNQNIKTFYNLGWAGFFFVFAFNIGFLVLFFIDIGRSFKYNTRQLVEQSRRVYYYEKLKKYESQNQEVPLGLVNRWVKLGNLNKRKYEQLPDINLRVQYFRLIKHNQYYDVQVLKIVDLFLNIDLNYHQENNTKTGKKIKKRLKLSKDTSKKLYMVINDIFQKYSKKDTEAIVLKTYTLIQQNKFQPGDKIPLLPNDMFQKIQLQDHFGNKKSTKLPQKLKGFPINAYDLESI